MADSTDRREVGLDLRGTLAERFAFFGSQVLKSDVRTKSIIVGNSEAGKPQPPKQTSQEPGLK